jgi:hypothetical protein
LGIWVSRLNAGRGGESKKCLPEAALGADAEILKNKPDSNLILDIMKTKSTGSQTTNEVSCKHALRLTTTDGHALGHATKLMVIDPRRPIGR